MQYKSICLLGIWHRKGSFISVLVRIFFFIAKLNEAPVHKIPAKKSFALLEKKKQTNKTKQNKKKKKKNKKKNMWYKLYLYERRCLRFLRQIEFTINGIRYDFWFISFDQIYPGDIYHGIFLYPVLSCTYERQRK